jgi:hypothetical protein
MANDDLKEYEQRAVAAEKSLAALTAKVDALTSGGGSGGNNAVSTTQQFLSTTHHHPAPASAHPYTHTHAPIEIRRLRTTRRLNA